MTFYFKFALRVILISIALIFFLNLRNKSCLEQEDCNPIYFSHYLKNYKKIFSEKQSVQKFTEVKINFFANSSINEVEIYSSSDLDSVDLDTIKIHKFFVTNNSSKSVSISPIIEISPSDLSENVIRYECDCSKNFKLKSGETKVLKIVFEIDSNISSQDVKELNVTYNL